MMDLLSIALPAVPAPALRCPPHQEQGSAIAKVQARDLAGQQLFPNLIHHAVERDHSLGQSMPPRL